MDIEKPHKHKEEIRDEHSYNACTDVDYQYTPDQLAMSVRQDTNMN